MQSTPSNEDGDFTISNRENEKNGYNSKRTEEIVVDFEASDKAHHHLVNNSFGIFSMRDTPREQIPRTIEEEIKHDFDDVDHHLNSV